MTVATCDNRTMATKTTTTLETAIEAVRKLPEEAQTAIAQEMIEHADAIANYDLSDEQRAIVKERLAQPRTPLSVQEFQAFLDQYRVA